MKASIWAHAADLLDEGPAAAFAAVKQMGLASISLAATDHAGVSYYAPDPKSWAGLKLQPKLAETCHGRDLCREVRDAAAKTGIATNARIVALHNRRLGAAHPDCTIVNCFGERYLHALCPSHPDSRAFAVTLAADVEARVQPAALELESFGFMGFAHSDQHDKAGVKLDGAHEFLLSLCCCDPCTRRMAERKVDLRSIAEKARKLVQQFLDHGGRGGPGPGASRLDRAEEIGPWLVKQLGAIECARILSARKEVVVSLVEEIRARVPKAMKLYAMAHPSPFVTGAAIGGGLLALGELVDGFILNFHQTTPTDLPRLRAEVKSAREAATPKTRFIANLRAFAPDSADEAQFLAKVAAIRAEGLDELRIDHDGPMARANAAWVRKAVQS